MISKTFNVLFRGRCHHKNILFNLFNPLFYQSFQFTIVSHPEYLVQRIYPRTLGFRPICCRGHYLPCPPQQMSVTAKPARSHCLDVLAQCLVSHPPLIVALMRLALRTPHLVDYLYPQQLVHRFLLLVVIQPCLRLAEGDGQFFIGHHRLEVGSQRLLQLVH